MGFCSFCGNLCETVCRPFGALLSWCDKKWNAHNKICVGFLLVIGLVFSIAMLAQFSSQYDDHLENPSEFHYTTCFITNIRSYKDEDDKEWRDITFAYGTSNDDWSQEGMYTASKDDWNNAYIKSDVGTCVYSLDPNVGETFTINNYLIHRDTSAMFLILDNKYVTISWIIFFVFGCLFTGVAAVTWVGKQCELVKCEMASIVGAGIWIGACMVVGWPVMIMGSVIQSGLNGPLADGITVADVYSDFGDCRIDAVTGIVHYNDTSSDLANEVSYTFTLVKYDVFTKDSNQIAINLHTGDDPLYFDIGTWHECYQNRFTQQLMLTEYPTVDWLQPPMTSAVLPIVLGCLLICAPCVLALASLAN